MSAKRSGPQPLNATEQALMDAHRTIGELEADKYALEQQVEKLGDLLREACRALENKGMSTTADDILERAALAAEEEA